MNLITYGNPVDPGALMQIKTCLYDERAAKGILCADHHKGYNQPVGGVVAYRNAVSVSGVGYDIGCGNKAVRLDVPANEIKNNIQSIMDDIFSQLEFGVGKYNTNLIQHELFDSEIWKLDAVKSLRQKAQQQLGTIGSGNHYVDIFIDELDRVWVGVHFGSRGLGHTTATWFLKAANAKNDMDAAPCVLDVESQLGQEYLACMELAGLYAYAGRDWVCKKVASLLQASIVEEVHNHHNYAWKEVHEGEELYVVRKGATPAFPGQKGFVGGSMGDDAVIIEGVNSQEAQEALYSAMHGAGRVMSRTQAAGKMDYKTRKRITEGAISYPMMYEWINAKGVELRGAGTDEAPQAYKRLSDVLEAHNKTIKVLHTLKPIGVAMAGSEVFDPYKD